MVSSGPRYDLARRKVPVTAVDQLVQAWVASKRDVFGNGIINPSMGAPGGRMDIGIGRGDSSRRAPRQRVS